MRPAKTILSEFHTGKSSIQAFRMPNGLKYHVSGISDRKNFRDREVKESASRQGGNLLFF